MTSTTPRKMMTKSRMPAMTPAIFTVWSVCFSGSTASGFRVAAPATGSPDNHCWNESLWLDENTSNGHHVTHRHSAAGSEWNKIYLMMCFLLVTQVSVSRHWIIAYSSLGSLEEKKNCSDDSYFYYFRRNRLILQWIMSESYTKIRSAHCNSSVRAGWVL